MSLPLEPIEEIPTTARISDDLPYVVRLGTGKLLLGLLASIAYSVLSLVVVLGAITVLVNVAAGRTTNSPSGAALFLLTVLVILRIGAMIVVTVRGIVDGPVLGLTPEGMWIRGRRFKPAVWLPWPAVSQVYRRRRNLARVLCFLPRATDAYTAFESPRPKRWFGTGLVVPLSFAVQPEQEIVDAIAKYSAGRVLIS